MTFAQNTRDEVRVQGDGTVVGSLSARPGMKQTTYVVALQSDGSTSINSHGSGYQDDGSAYTLNCIDRQSVMCLQDGQANGGICDDHAPTLNAMHEQPIVIDRAAYNQGANAAYPPHIEQTQVMDALVGARAACDSVQLSSGDDAMRMLCADDHKGVNSQYVNDGKVICQRITC